jgi:LacI family transcriptional regulator
MNSQKPAAAEEVVTLTKVAEVAGVAVMTASRALSGGGYISEKTKAKVQAVAKELGYSPNVSARLMRGGRTNVIGVLVTDLNSSVVNMIVGEITNYVRKAGMDLLIYNAVEDLGSERSGGGADLLKGMCDGLILVLPRIRQGHIAQLEKSTTPIVLVNYWRSDTRLPVVRADNYFGARDAVRHLLRQGHRRIGFVAGSAYSGQSQERHRGYLDALAEQEIAPDAELTADGDFSQMSGLAAGRRLLALASPPSAIFAANDEMAYGVMDAARALDLRIPDDISVIGFDDIDASALTHPPLTTIRQPLARISESAVHELLSRLNGTAQAHSFIELPSELVLRGSTAPLAQKPVKTIRSRTSRS